MNNLMTHDTHQLMCTILLRVKRGCLCFIFALFFPFVRFLLAILGLIDYWSFLLLFPLPSSPYALCYPRIEPSHGLNVRCVICIVHLAQTLRLPIAYFWTKNCIISSIVNNNVSLQSFASLPLACVRAICFARYPSLLIASVCYVLCQPLMFHMTAT